jgi:hypothetical protein
VDDVCLEPAGVRRPARWWPDRWSTTTSGLLSSSVPIPLALVGYGRVRLSATATATLSVWVGELPGPRAMAQVSDSSTLPGGRLVVSWRKSSLHGPSAVVLSLVMLDGRGSADA